MPVCWIHILLSIVRRVTGTTCHHQPCRVKTLVPQLAMQLMGRGSELTSLLPTHVRQWLKLLEGVFASPFIRGHRVWRTVRCCSAGVGMSSLGEWVVRFVR